MNFNFKKSIKFKEVFIIKPDFFEDHRGLLYTSYLENEFKEKFGNSFSFNHNKYVNNNKNVLRGIHGDYSSYKMVSCVYGKIFQVVVDNRSNSETYLEHETFELSHEVPCQVLIPPGFGNAFFVLSDYAVYNYQLSYKGNYNDYNNQFTLKWNDKKINITWPSDNPILSDRDK
jgi:dTDP-4-dehydrorhamnose 3,5-epimerase